MSVLDETIKRELNDLKPSELVQILIEKKLDNIKISERLKKYLLKVFSVENNTDPRCLKCIEIVEELKLIKREVEECKEAFIKLEKGLTGNGVGDVSTASTCFIKKDVRSGKGQCDFNEIDKMGIKTSASEVYTVSQIECELKQFYEFCKANNLTDEEIAHICKPLASPKSYFNTKSIRYTVIFLVIIAILYLLSHFETIEWHYVAIGRIFLIEFLPIWNWKHMKNEKCLINPINNIQSDSEVIQDCTFCEYIQKIDVMDPYQPDVTYEKFIKIHKPVILENGLENWQDPTNLDELLKIIFEDDVLSESMPCKFKSNVFHGSANLFQSLKNIKDNDVYFAHFQNCEFDAVKAFRKYFKRPKFLAAEILPIQYSWLLVSKDYDIEKYKPILLADQITVIGQFLGKNHILLYPNECMDDCESLKIELVMGEVLIFSGLWNMEYKPEPEGENMAVILETH